MPTLLVASGGGHLKQLIKLRPRLGIEGDVTWVTFDTGLGRSLGESEEVLFAPYANPHDLAGTAKDAKFALDLFRSRKFDRVISTGANLAVAFLPVGLMFGAKATYIETATRSDALSVTGRVIDKVPRVQRFVQHRGLANKRWTLAGSVFDGFRAQKFEAPEIKRVVVTLGSNDSYGFDRLLVRLQEIIPPGVDVLWQTGKTTLKIDGAHETVPAAVLEAAMSEADVVVAHSGTGSALSALEAGRLPVLVVRRAAHDEHIDDHQELTANQLADVGLALSTEADEVTWRDLVSASRWRVVERDAPDLGLIV